MFNFLLKAALPTQMFQGAQSFLLEEEVLENRLLNLDTMGD